MRPTHPLFTGMPTTIFEVMSRLAIEHKAVNLGQGFPDVDGPREVRQAAADALMEGPNQYPPMMGLPELRQAVADSEHRFFGIERDAADVLITSGATEALSDALMAIVEPGDEVVVFDPCYDCYVPLIRRAGGVPKVVPLSPPNWSFSDDDLDAAFSSKTKAILINNPHNPASKVFSRGELERVAAKLVAHDAYAICDEVYEHLVFGDAEPHPSLHFATYGRAHRAYRFSGQDLFADGMEGRLHQRPASAATAYCQGTPVHDLHHTTESAEGGGVRAWTSG
jgi:N-succinyldiaminopimelate aminotransferase